MEPRALLEMTAASTDPGPRARALSWLVLTDTAPGGGQFGPRGLFDPDPWVQRAVVEALVRRLPDAVSAELLRTYIARSDELADSYVRGHTALLLIRAGLADDPLRQALTTARNAPSEPWARAPLALASAILGDTAAVPVVSQALSKGDLPLEIDFALDLARSGLSELLPALREALSSAEDELVLPLATAAAALGDPEGEAILRRALAGSEEIEAMDALDLVSALRGEMADELLRRTAGSGNSRVSSYAQLALVARGKGEPDVIHQASTDDDRVNRLLAIRFARELAADSVNRRAARLARGVLVQGIDDSDAQVRAKACAAAADLHLREAEGAFRRALDDEYLDVRIEAAGGLLVLSLR